MEIYNPILDKEETENTKSHMEVLTEYIIEQLNDYIEHQKEARKFVSVFRGLLPGVDEATIDFTIKSSKDLIKSLITNDVDLFIDSVANFGTESIKLIPRETQEEMCKNFRLELYKNAEKAFENNK